MTQTLSAITVPNVKLPLSEAIGTQRDWVKTEYYYRGYPIYQSMADGHLCYEADGTHLVELPDAVENVILDAMLLDILCPGYVVEGSHA